MANNRMYLVCKGCDKGFLLGKTMSTGYHTFYDAKDLHDDINDFFSEHHCCDEKREVHYDNQFEIRYEFAHEEDLKEY
jgi:hypothetical protein